jgi:glycerol kinase
MWDAATGQPVHDAIVWISSQTDDIVARWRAAGYDDLFPQRTGLRNDSFFSVAKIVWLLEEVPGVRARAEAGQLRCGTIDSWLLWNLTAGRSHLTDHSCASRTGLFDPWNLRWDAELCALLGIPMSLLPAAGASDSEFGTVEGALLGGRVPIHAVIADQQASMYGQACFGEGDGKKTFGTAGVLCVNTGDAPLLIDGTTASVGWTAEAETRYELEGVVFHSGQTLQWMRDRPAGRWAGRRPGPRRAARSRPASARRAGRPCAGAAQRRAASAGRGCAGCGGSWAPRRSGHLRGRGGCSAGR